MEGMNVISWVVIAISIIGLVVIVVKDIKKKVDDGF